MTTIQQAVYEAVQRLSRYASRERGRMSCDVATVLLDLEVARDEARRLTVENAKLLEQAAKLARSNAQLRSESTALCFYAGLGLAAAS